MQRQTSFLSLQELVILALLGTLWAVLEIHLGITLHLLRLPFAGVILTFWGVVILLVGRAFITK